MSVLAYIKHCFREGTRISRFNILSAALLGAPAHMMYYFLFKYVFHLPYESLWLRITASSLSFFSFFLGSSERPFIKKIFPFYWHFSIIFVLPFIFTVYLLKNDFHELWLYWEIFMIFILITFVPNWLMFLFDLLVGVSAAVLYFILTSPDVQLHPDFDILLYSIVIGFTIVAGYLFSYSNKKGQVAQERNTALQAMAGSIAHEMRNPLGQVTHNIEAIEHDLPDFHFGKSMVSMSSATLEKLYRYVAQSKLAVTRGSQVITMILEEVREKEIDSSTFIFASSVHMTQKAIDEYGFESDEERNKVIVERKDDFVFRIGETMYIFVLFNLIMNALYFLKSRPDSRIYIRLEKGKDTNCVKIKDTGPGIPPENLSKLFDAYFTYGRKGGTGLGLSYCKRVMQAFGGDITCDSVEGEYTEFTLSFPPVSSEDIQQDLASVLKANKSLFQNKRLLVVDDEEADRSEIRDLMTQLGAFVYVAGDGREALTKLSGSLFDLVVMNLKMPGMNGYEASERIRKGEGGNDHRRVPIVAYTAGLYYIVRTKTEKAGMQGLISKPCLPSQFVREIAAFYRDFGYYSHRQLHGLSLLVVDDSSFNRITLKTILEKEGITIDEAGNGEEALLKIRNGSFDLVLMDIRMPHEDGIAATKRIRALGDPGSASVPVLGLSGESDDYIRDEAMQAGMNDFIIKPIDTRLLLMKISHWAG